MRIKQLVTASFFFSFIPLTASAVTYTVEDLGTVNNVKSSYAMGSNNAGIVAATAKERFEPNLNPDPEDGDLELGDDIKDNINDNINDDNDFNDEDDDYLRLPQGNEVAFTTDGNSATRLTIFDVIYEDTGELTGTTNDIALDINDASMVVGTGSAPYKPITHINNAGIELTYFGREFRNRGFVSLGGGTLALLPPNAEYGGVSTASDINNSNLVVGYASIDLTKSSREYAENSCPKQDLPLMVCTRSLNYQLRAYQWQLDDQGNVLSTKELGLLAKPNSDDNRQYISKALAVNEQGTAVGMSYAFEDGDDRRLRTYAAIYQNDEVLDITDPDKFRASIAYDISDENTDGISYVVGDVTRLINGYWRSKFFYYELGKEDAIMQVAYGDDSIVKDFYNGSSSTARAVNANGLVVGFGEYERVSPQLPRRKHAFIYDIKSNTFSDLNHLLPCDSEYQIVEANAIDDNNNIMAVALISVPAIDPYGEPVLNADGTQANEEVARAVRLHYDATEIPDICPEDVEEKFSRSGASMGGVVFFSLFLALVQRRRWLMLKTD
jgi:uncharacterized membrane protein